MNEKNVPTRTTVPRAHEEHATDRPVYAPLVDILEYNDRYELYVEMPGVSQKNVDVTVEQKVVTIHGSVREEIPADYQLRHSEYGTGDYHRTFRLTDAIDEEKIRASFQNGVLVLSLPKALPSKRKIEITAS